MRPISRSQESVNFHIYKTVNTIHREMNEISNVN